jgi:hypothetical protein
MDNPEALASLGTQETGRRPTKQKSTIQHRKIKRRATRTHQKKSRMNPISSYKKPIVLFIKLLDTSVHSKRIDTHNNMENK